MGRGYLLHRYYLAWTFFLIFSACHSRTVVYEPPAPDSLKNRPAIIFVPGFYGTALADEKSGERVFLSAYSSVFGSRPLALSDPDLGVAGARPLRPDGVLEYVRIIPGIFSRNVYGEALSFLRKNYGERAEIVPFAYDWRKDLFGTVEQLDARVKSLERAGAGPIYLVAHSMGGLVAAYYLRYGARPPESVGINEGLPPRTIRAAVLAGVPFGGTPVAFRNLQTGTSLGPAKTPLNQISLSTFPAMYHLIPAETSDAYVNFQMRPLAFPVYSAPSWAKLRLGLFRDRTDGEWLARRRRATETYLTRAAAYVRAIGKPAAGPTKSATPILVAVGTGFPTLARVAWTGETLDATGRWIFSDENLPGNLPRDFSLVGDGDATVPTRFAQPPSGFAAAFQTKTLSITMDHEGMFAEEAFRKEILAFFKSAAL